ncbi:MAG: hypothetical protein ACXW1S_06010 [Acidimicrobiia bacterium]
MLQVVVQRAWVSGGIVPGASPLRLPTPGADGAVVKTLVRIRSAASDETTDGSPPEAEAPVPADVAGAAHAVLPLVALVLGVAGAALGVSVIWYFAAIPTGISAVVVGVIAHRRVARATDSDPRERSRAVIGAVLGLVAIVLGISGALYLPRVMDRADRFIGSVQDDVNENVRLVNNGTQRDVDRLDATLTRDLKRFEDQNKADVTGLEQRTSAALATLEARMAADLKSASADAKTDLDTLETALRADLQALEAALRDTDAKFEGKISALDARITTIERRLGL